MSEPTPTKVMLSLESMGFERRYIERSTRVFARNFPERAYNLELIIEIISRLKEKDKWKHNPFVAHMKMEELMQLQTGDTVDHRDEVGRYVNAEIVERKGTVVKIHHIGWSHKWDCYSDLKKESVRFAQSESISRRPPHRFTLLKKGDFVDICPKLRHPSVCFPGEIRRIDKYKGQVQVKYEKDSKNYLYWAHLDDVSEIDEINSHFETLRKRRDKRFPLLRADEVIANPYAVGDIIEMRDATGHWIVAVVTDIHNNWVALHCDGCSVKYDQFLHVLEMKARLRPITSALDDTKIASESELESTKASVETVEDNAERKRIRHRERRRRRRKRKAKNKRFPLLCSDEIVQNPYAVGARIALEDPHTGVWNAVAVVDKHNNWVVLRFDDSSAKSDERVHVLEMNHRLRSLESSLSDAVIASECEIKEDSCDDQVEGEGERNPAQDRGSPQLRLKRSETRRLPVRVKKLKRRVATGKWKAKEKNDTSQSKWSVAAADDFQHRILAAEVFAVGFGTRFCSSCGIHTEAHWRFCPLCGTQTTV